MGLPTEETILDYGDLFWEGKGAAGTTVTVGIEFKKLGELITSIRDGRLAGHQLPGMQRYDYRWLLYEGDWRRDDATGLMLEYKGPKLGWKPLHGKMPASEFQKHLMTYLVCGGINAQHTRTRAATLEFIRDGYRWFSDRALDEHASLSQIHTPPSIGTLSPFRKAVCAWPEIGIKTSRAVEERFQRSIRAAANASAVEWASIQTVSSRGERRFGQAAALRLTQFLKGELV